MTPPKGPDPGEGRRAERPAPGRGAAAPLQTAQAQLDRLLWLIPAAARPGGISLARAARTLGVDEGQILRDVEALTERSYYQPAGTAEGLMIEVTDRIEIFTTGEFGRPPRLTPRELFCVVLGLRMRGLRMPGLRTPAAHAALLARLEDQMAMSRDSGSGQGDLPLVDLAHLDGAWRPDRVLALVRQGWKDGRPLAFGYLKPGAEAPELRRLHCYALVHAEGRWYACGRDPEAAEGGEGDGHRNFRVDRILEVRLEGEPGEVRIPEDFDPATVLDGPRVFLGAEPSEAVVRYAPEVVPWIRERWAGEADGDGSYRVRHPVADPGWLLRHVLEYGAQAEVEAPAELREELGAILARMGGG